MIPVGAILGDKILVAHPAISQTVQFIKMLSQHSQGANHLRVKYHKTFIGFVRSHNSEHQRLNYTSIGILLIKLGRLFGQY
jgi:hypothetical protein